MDNKNYIDTFLVLGYFSIDDIKCVYEYLVDNPLDLERLVKYYVKDKDKLLKVLNNYGTFIMNRREDINGMVQIYDKICEIIELYNRYDIKAYMNFERILAFLALFSTMNSNLSSDVVIKDLNSYKLIKFGPYMETILIDIKSEKYRLTTEDSSDTFDVYKHISGKLIETNRVGLVIKDGKERFYYEHELNGRDKKELEESYDYDVMITV